jgi:hypothetical protein
MPTLPKVSVAVELTEKYLVASFVLATVKIVPVVFEPASINVPSVLMFVPMDVVALAAKALHTKRTRAASAIGKDFLTVFEFETDIL